MTFYYDDEVVAVAYKTLTGDYGVTTARGRRLFTNTGAAVEAINEAIGGDMGAMVAIDAEMLAVLVSGINIG